MAKEPVWPKDGSFEVSVYFCHCIRAIAHCAAAHVLAFRSFGSELSVEIDVLVVRHHFLQLEYPLGGSALPPPCLVFKANKELLGLLGVGSGTGRKRRRETPLTLQFDDKAKGSLLVSGVPSAPFDIKFNKEDDGAVTECFNATSELQAAGTVLGRVQFGRPGSDQKAIAAVSG